MTASAATSAAAHSKKLMKLTLSLFGNSFNASKCKTAAKMAVARIKLLRNKRQVVVKQMRRDIALLLQSGQDATARIRVEHVIREQNVLAANEFIELFCELVVARLTIIKKRRECPADLKEGIASLIFASPRCAEIPELIEIRNIFEKKYGRDFVAAATDLRPNCGVNRLLIDKLSVKTPTGEVKLQIMREIAKEHNIEWDTSESEKELLKPPEELIEGPRTFVSATSLPVKPATNHCPEPKENMIRGEEGHTRFKDTVAAAEAAEESARNAIAAAQTAAYLANRDSKLFSHDAPGRVNSSRDYVPTYAPGAGRTYGSESFGTFNAPSSDEVRVSNDASGRVNSSHGYVPTCAPGARRMNESRSFGTSYAPSNDVVRAGNDEKMYRRHSYNNAPAAHSDIKFDESDCDDDETDCDDDPGSINLPPSVPSSLDKQDSIHRVHPKLPDYDDLAARFEALKYRKSLP